jgi:transcription elongation GreA/GreB family factor
MAQGPPLADDRRMPLRNTSIGPPTPTPNGPVLTAAAAEMLAAEVERLRALRDEEFTARRREALAVSGSDEDAHLAIGEDEGVSNARIANLEALLRHATVVAHEPAGDDLAGIGSTVTVEDVVSGRQHEYVLVAWHDGARGTVSAASPVGQAILGRGVGDEASIELPGGRDRRLRIVAVQQAVPAGP